MLRNFLMQFNFGKKVFSLEVSYLKRHVSTMEEITQNMKHLDIAADKEVGIEPCKPLFSLKEVITTFVEKNINPRCYQNIGSLQLRAASPVMLNALSNVNKTRDSYDTDADLRNFYFAALKKAFN